MEEAFEFLSKAIVLPLAEEDVALLVGSEVAARPIDSFQERSIGNSLAVMSRTTPLFCLAGALCRFYIREPSHDAKAWDGSRHRFFR